MTLHDHLASYLRACKRRGYTESTLHHKEKESRLFLEHLAGTGHSMVADDVTAEHIEASIDDMQDRGLRMTTIKTRRRTLHAWWNWMAKRKIVQANVVAEVEAPKTPKIRKPSLSEADFEKVLAACDPGTLTGSRRMAMLLLVVSTGLRRGELAALRRDDLDWERGRVLVRQGKGQKDRNVPFLPGVQEAINRYLAHRTDQDPALWVTEKGLPFRYDGIGLDIKRLYQRAGVEVVDVLHVYRRSLATSAARQRMPRWYTNRILGWSDDQMQSYYTANMENEDEAIAYFTQNFEPLGEEPTPAAGDPPIRPAGRIEVEESAAPKFLPMREATYYCHQRVFIVAGEDRIEVTVDELPAR